MREQSTPRRRSINSGSKPIRSSSPGAAAERSRSDRSSGGSGFQASLLLKLTAGTLSTPNGLAQPRYEISSGVSPVFFMIAFRPRPDVRLRSKKTLAFAMQIECLSSEHRSKRRCESPQSKIVAA
jgi:hypothetical protein